MFPNDEGIISLFCFFPFFLVFFCSIFLSHLHYSAPLYSLSSIICYFRLWHHRKIYDFQNRKNWGTNKQCFLHPSSLVVIYVGSIFVELSVFMYVYMAINLFDLTWLTDFCTGNAVVTSWFLSIDSIMQKCVYAMVSSWFQLLYRPGPPFTIMV